ncbi:hypothetical protein CGRA01v4_11121 [Colletotrichum graminicola]|nr:hypothetical protein CGRA01v4_11121 [Colletotrichum graminicola]
MKSLVHPISFFCQSCAICQTEASPPKKK